MTVTEQNFKLKFFSQGCLARKSYFKIWPPNKNTYLHLYILFHSVTTGQDTLQNWAFLAVILFRNSFGAENGNVSKSVLILQSIQHGSHPNNFNSDLFNDPFQLQNIVITAIHELGRIWKEAASA
jgi:hypothetical protein